MNRRISPSRKTPVSCDGGLIVWHESLVEMRGVQRYVCGCSCGGTVCGSGSAARSITNSSIWRLSTNLNLSDEQRLDSFIGSLHQLRRRRRRRHETRYTLQKSNAKCHKIKMIGIPCGEEIVTITVKLFRYNTGT